MAAHSIDFKQSSTTYLGFVFVFVLALDQSVLLQLQYFGDVALEGTLKRRTVFV